MNKSQLINSLASKACLTKIKSKMIIKSILEIITESLQNGNSVQIVGFGTFKVQHRNARIGRHPQTGKEIKIKARNIPVFVSGKTLKNAIKKKI
ncbi:MAG: HU family DNA-binding protein [Enterobacterales bacterium]